MSDFCCEKVIKMGYERKKKLMVRIVAGICAFMLLGSIFVSVLAK